MNGNVSYSLRIRGQRLAKICECLEFQAKSGDEAIRRLLPFKLKDQYAFKSEKALELLTFKRGIFV